jgi:hypothetical protein
MTSQVDNSQNSPKSGADEAPDGSDVVKYLKTHPDFLLDHPELMAVLTPPSHRSGENVLDLQLFMLEQLQKEVRKLSGNWSELIATSRSNMATQAQVHTAVLAMLKSEGLATLYHTVSHDFADILNMDVVTLCLEEGATCSLPPSDTTVRSIASGTVDRLMGPGRDILLRSKAEQLDEIFGPAASLVRSDALIRLSFGEDAPGVLALGAREVEKFHPGQGTELMGFLARTLEICIARWKAP